VQRSPRGDGTFRLPRKVTFFSPAHEGDSATGWSSTIMIPKLSEAFAVEFPEWERVHVLGKDAMKARLAEILAGGERPAFTFITCQAYTGEQPYTGAVICQDLPKFYSTKLVAKPEDFNSGCDISPDATPFGTVSFIFTSSSVGVENAVAFLPQKLMGHPNGGSLAVIGCLEKLYLGTRNNPFLDRSGSTEAFLEPYCRWIAGLARDLPVGLAVAALRGDTSVSTRWVILGDPAVRLMV
jgi:hypothetical protein